MTTKIRYPNGMTRPGNPATPLEHAEVAMQQYADAVEELRTSIYAEPYPTVRVRGDGEEMVDAIANARQARTEFTAARVHAVNERYNVRDLDMEIADHDRNFTLWCGLVALPHLKAA